MTLIGSAPALRCPCDGTLLVGKDVQPLQSVKPIRIAVSTVLDESRCGHKKVCGCVPGLPRMGSPVVP
jgi:hypothetical protein